MMTSTTVHENQPIARRKRLALSLDTGLLAHALLLLALFAALFAVVQYATPGLIGNDGYYHIKMGYLIRQQGLKPAFPWLPMTILNPAAFYDHHLLYHAFLALFATTDPTLDGGLALTNGAKVASVLMPSLAFLAIWWLMRSRQVPFAWLWAIGLFAVSEAFLYRMSMPRAQSASLFLLILGLHWLLQGHYGRLVPLGFIYVWTYNAFPLLLLVGGAFLVSAWFVERRIYWQAVLYPALGIFLGLLINPYFPENITFIVSHLLPKVGEPATRVGNEWYPYRTWTLVENSGFALLAMVLAMLAWGWNEKRPDRTTLTVMVLTVLFGAMLFKARRFVEYFPPFALILLALSTAPLLQSWTCRKRWSSLLTDRAEKAIRRILPALVLLVLLIWPLQVTMKGSRAAVARAKPADQYASAALWLHENGDPGAHIFQTDWDDFTRLFFYHDDAIYTAGLDPTYLELYDGELFDEWVDITRGEGGELGYRIATRFQSDYVFTDLQHDDFLEAAAADPMLRELYRDQYAVIFAVNRQGAARSQLTADQETTSP